SPNVCFTTDCDSGCSTGETLYTKQLRTSIYPNPAFSLLTVEINAPDLYEVEITNLNGKLIQVGEFIGATHQIDLSSFQKGVYFITIRSKDFVTTRKIVKL
ncbi:MAG: T9SS type A sorting domain-containing protein, partial [Anaerolineales bacterium]